MSAPKTHDRVRAAAFSLFDEIATNVDLMKNVISDNIDNAPEIFDRATTLFQSWQSSQYGDQVMTWAEASEPVKGSFVEQAVQQMAEESVARTTARIAAKTDPVGTAAIALFDHWQRDAKDAARTTWADASDQLKAVFIRKAEAVVDALFLTATES